MQRHRLSRRAPQLLAVPVLLVGLALPAAAQQTINPEQACKDDAFRLCNEFIPDRDRVGACLRRNARRLSRDCRTVVFGGGTRGPTHRTYRHYHHHHHTH